MNGGLISASPIPILLLWSIPFRKFSTFTKRFLSRGNRIPFKQASTVVSRLHCMILHSSASWSKSVFQVSDRRQSDCGKELCFSVSRKSKSWMTTSRCLFRVPLGQRTCFLLLLCVVVSPDSSLHVALLFLLSPLPKPRFEDCCMFVVRDLLNPIQICCWESTKVWIQALLTAQDAMAQQHTSAAKCFCSEV